MESSNQNSYERILSDGQVAAFRRDGFIKLDNFYDLESEVFPVQEGIRQIIGMMVQKYLHGKRLEDGADRPFDDGFLDLVVADHVSHFSESSLRELLEGEGFEVMDIDAEVHAGAWIFFGRRSDEVHREEGTDDVLEIRKRALEMADYGMGFHARVREL